MNTNIIIGNILFKAKDRVTGVASYIQGEGQSNRCGSHIFKAKDRVTGVAS